MTPRYPVMSAQHTVIPAKAGIHPSRKGAPCGRPSLPPLPLWGRLERGRAPSGLFSRPETFANSVEGKTDANGWPLGKGGGAGSYPSVIPAGEGIPPSRRGAPCGRPSLRPLPRGETERGRASAGARAPEGRRLRLPHPTATLEQPAPIRHSRKAGIHPSRRGAPCGRPSLRPLPLWGRLREGARRQPRKAPSKGARTLAFLTQRAPANPPPSVIPAKAGIPPSRRGAPCGRPSLRPVGETERGRAPAGARAPGGRRLRLPHPTATLAQPAPIRHSRGSGNPSRLPASPPVGETERGRAPTGARAPKRAPPPASPPNGDPCATRPHPSFPRKQESIPPSGLSPCGGD